MHALILLWWCLPLIAQEDADKQTSSRQEANEYCQKGEEKYRKDDFAGAIEDYTRTIEIIPYIEAYTSRGQMKVIKGDREGAIADYSIAIAGDPKDVHPYTMRGWARYDMRQFGEAMQDFRKAADLTPLKPTHARLWIWIIRARDGELDAATKELKDHLAQLRLGPLDEWWSKIAGFLVGDLSEADFFRAAEDKDEMIARRHKMQAHFYVGIYCLSREDDAAAKEHFSQCIKTDFKYNLEYQSAAAELESLK